MSATKQNRYIPEMVSIRKLRKRLDLKPIKQGKRSCLKCDTTFFSEDLERIKICSLCNKINSSRLESL